MRIAVLSDVHALASAFESALTAARREGFDVMLILGDLLTYGVEPVATLDLAADAVARDDARLLLGNHDQIYLDLATGGSAYIDGLPQWIRQSVDWTRATMGAELRDWSLPWTTQWSEAGLFAAHANPFSYGDWTYLSRSEPISRARSELRSRGYRAGVFGHTHRAMTADTAGHPMVATVGSLGQPREGHPGVSQWAMVSVTDGGVRVSPRAVEVDWARHMTAIRATDMPEDAKDRLCGFFA